MIVYGQSDLFIKVLGQTHPITPIVLYYALVYSKTPLKVLMVTARNMVTICAQAADRIAFCRKPFLIFCHDISLGIRAVMKIKRIIFQNPSRFLYLLQRKVK